MNEWNSGYSYGFDAGCKETQERYDTAVLSLRDTCRRLRESNEIICQLAMKCLPEETVQQIKDRVDRIR